MTKMLERFVTGSQQIPSNWNKSNGSYTGEYSIRYYNSSSLTPLVDLNLDFIL